MTQIQQQKAAQMIAANPAIRAALVSTNSITQGEQVANLWKPLFEHYNIHFDFAYRTFRWDSEADIKAHVHCVIIGFSSVAGDCQSPLKKIFLSAAHTKRMTVPSWLHTVSLPRCPNPSALLNSLNYIKN